MVEAAGVSEPGSEEPYQRVAREDVRRGTRETALAVYCPAQAYESSQDFMRISEKCFMPQESREFGLEERQSFELRVRAALSGGALGAVDVSESVGKPCVSALAR
ncbi:hypothetical protein P9139_06610 [Curtobacterium flaccumfaciens]|nr:hypothetical protein P9139_06610 [Curtobacterium flaccumfaciens]